jgi:hypothetical protein
MAEVGTEGERDKETQSNEREAKRGGATVARNTRKRIGKELGHSCLLFSKAGLGIYIVRVRIHSDTMYATQRERGGER